MVGVQTDPQNLVQALLAHPALFVTELAAVTGASGPALEDVLADLSEDLVVVNHHPSDHHLRGDLRIVAWRDRDAHRGRPPAERRVADHWTAFLRQIANSHRCA